MSEHTPAPGSRGWFSRLFGQLTLAEKCLAMGATLVVFLAHKVYGPAITAWLYPSGCPGCEGTDAAIWLATAAFLLAAMIIVVSQRQLDNPFTVAEAVEVLVWGGLPLLIWLLTFQSFRTGTWQTAVAIGGRIQEAVASAASRAATPSDQQPTTAATTAGRKPCAVLLSDGSRIVYDAGIVQKNRGRRATAADRNVPACR